MANKKNTGNKSGKKKTPVTGKKITPERAKNKAEEIRDTAILLKSLIEKEREILQTEDILIESMKRFRDLFEQSPIGVGIHGTEGELLIVNKSYLEIFGLNSFGDIKKQDLFKEFGLTAQNVKELQSGKAIQLETEYNFEEFDPETSREGIGYMLTTISPLFREKEIIGYMRQMQDITANKKVAEAQRLAQLGRLLSDMAHEVNNPLMIISGRAELAILDEVKDPRARESLQVILDQCFLAKDIIQRLLKYSRVGKVKKKPTDIKKTIDLIVNILQHYLRRFDIVINMEFKTDAATIKADEKQLQEVFMNIIRNSADAMPHGGVITIKLSREEKSLRVDIEDTGEGMSKKVLDRILEPFYTTKQKGTGLGLAVCHTLIEENGGKLRYESELGKGTTASIWLPI